MFHQSNLRNYDGLHSLLGDLIDTTIRKYSQYMNLPVLSPRQDELGKRMAQRTAIQAAGIEAELIPGSGIWLRASRTAVISISGISVGNPAEIDTCSAGTYRIYGGKPTSWLQIDAGQWHWIPFAGGKGGKSSPQITVK
jgi:hypothetical protein